MLAQHYKRLHEEAIAQLREETRQHKRCATDYALLQQEHLAAMQRQGQLEEQLQTFRKQALANSAESRSESERSARLLRQELRDCEYQLESALQELAVMQTSRRLLVEEVKALRRQLRGPVQERLDFEGLRDEAIGMLNDKESQVRSLEGLVADLRAQLASHRKALQLGKELSEEAKRVTAAQEAQAAESAREHNAQLRRLREEAHAAATRAEGARELAIKEMAQRELLEGALKEQKQREARRVAADRLSALAATREELRQSLLRHSPVKSPMTSPERADPLHMATPGGAASTAKAQSERSTMLLPLRAGHVEAVG